MILIAVIEQRCSIKLPQWLVNWCTKIYSSNKRLILSYTLQKQFLTVHNNNMGASVRESASARRAGDEAIRVLGNAGTREE